MYYISFQTIFLGESLWGRLQPELPIYGLSDILYRASEEYSHLGELNLANPCAEEEHLSLSAVVNSVQETQHM